MQGSTLLVVDQNTNTVYALPTDTTQLGDGGLADGGPYPVYATVVSPDQLSAGPNGSVFTDQFRPATDGGPLQVRQIWPDGGVNVFAPSVDFAGPTDVAYDKTNHRLFVVDTNGTTVRTIKILPVP